MRNLNKTCFIFFLTILISSSLYGQGHINALKNGERNFTVLRQAFYDNWESNGKPYRELKRFKRWEEMMVPRLQNGLIPGSSYFSKKSELFQKEISKSSIHRKNSDQWTPIGPKEWEVASGGYNPGNGRVNCIAVSPENPEFIYIGAASGGFWKSEDGGKSWQTSTDDLGALGITDIYVNPDKPSEITILTGDAYGNDTPSIGLYKSVDYGESWSATSFSVDRNDFNIFFKYEVGHTNKSLMFVAGDGIHRSQDGGESWNQVSGANVSDLLFHPTNDNIIYACIGNESSVEEMTILKSIDAGITWSTEKFVFEDLNKLLGRKALAVSIDNPDVLYVLATAANSTYGGLFKSEDQATSFSLQSSSPNIFGYSLDGSDNDGQGSYDLSIAANPSNADEIYVSGIHIWKSTNAGIDWEIQNFWVWESEVNLPYVHADNHTLDFINGNLYAGGDGGIFVSKDDGQTFQNLSFGLNIGQFYRIGLHPTEEDGIIGGLQDNGSFTRHNDTWYHIFGADGMDALIDHTDPSIVYSEYQFGGIIRYRNHGLETDLFIENNAGESGGWITPFIMHPNDNNVLYFGFENVWKSIDKGNTLERVSRFSDANVIQILKIDPKNPNRLVVAKGGNLYLTINDGISWSNKTSGLPNGILQDLTFDAIEEKGIWAVVSPGMVYYSNNDGNSWESMSNGIPNMLTLNCIAQHPCNSTLYLGTDIGVYTYDLSVDNEWQFMGNQLPNVIIRELEIQQSTSKLYAGTYGRGIWKIDIPTIEEGTTVQTISFTEVTEKRFGDVPFLIEASSSSGLPLKYVSENTEIIEFVDGQAQINGIGSAQVSIYQEGNCEFSASDTARFQITILKGTQEINFVPIGNELRIKKGQKIELNASATSGLEVTFVSSNEDLIKINAKEAEITNLAAGGTVTITANQEGDELYEAAVPVSQEQTVLILSNDSFESLNSLMPNPATDFVSLPEINTKDDTYQIFNFDGRLIEKGPITEKLNVSHLQSGVYVLVSGNEKYKLIKD